KAAPVTTRTVGKPASVTAPVFAAARPAGVGRSARAIAELSVVSRVGPGPMRPRPAQGTRWRLHEAGAQGRERRPVLVSGELVHREDLAARGVDRHDRNTRSAED